MYYAYLYYSNEYHSDRVNVYTVPQKDALGKIMKRGDTESVYAGGDCCGCLCLGSFATYKSVRRFIQKKYPTFKGLGNVLTDQPDGFVAFFEAPYSIH